MSWMLILGLHCMVAELLVGHGADVNRQNKSQETPLYCASANGRLEVTELLVGHGADVNRQNKSQETPLHCALDKGKLEIAHFLIKRGSNVGSRDRHGQTSLHVAANRGYLDIVEMLLEMGSDIDARDKRGSSPFDLAPRFWQWEITWPLAKRFGPPEPVNPWHGNRKTSGGVEPQPPPWSGFPTPGAPPAYHEEYHLMHTLHIPQGIPPYAYPEDILTVT
ncbi:ankyrin repeat-containing domain protein [Lactarius deliciosus]|nr:ankyrin repeat-containing domain protein [Lactarius deliciosus]